jgi:hypothetical protein
LNFQLLLIAETRIFREREMRFLFTLEETAEALRMSVAEFSATLEKLYEMGFPRAVAGLGARWSIMDVMLWVRHQSERAMPGNDARTESQKRLN